MSEARPSPAAPITGGEGLRLVLIGRPGAGKTSLLGALAQAVQTQEHLLNGRLTEPTPALEGLRRQVYDEGTRPTPEEVVLYPVEFESFGRDGTAAREHFRALLIDCDGRVANDLLTRRQGIAPENAQGPLAREVLAADALILVVDGSETPGQIDADFTEFRRFLRLFEKGRGQRTEVGGLPVFLVLTKCDLLATPNDQPVAWAERLEEKKRQVAQRFREFLAEEDGENGSAPFGTIDLNPWATAVKRPPLAGTQARPREPYGIAELFRQGLDAARAFHERGRRSTRRLLWTVGGAGGLVALLAALAVGMFSKAIQDSDADAQPVRTLQNKVDSFQLGEGQTVADRLKGNLAHLRQRIGVLTELRSDPVFEKLPQDQQAYVEGRLQELRDYVAYYEKLQQTRRPTEARTEAEWSDIEQALKTDLAVPRPAWGQTEAARLHQDYQDQITALRRAADNVAEWYRQRQREGEKLWTFAGRQPGVAGSSIDWHDWQADAERLLGQTEKPPFRETDRLPGPGAPTFGETVFLTQRVQETRHDWETTRRRLQRLLDLSAALGLGGQLAPRPAPLALPRKPPFTTGDSAERLQRLREAYPRYKEEFVLAGLPEAAVGDIRQAATNNYDLLMEAGRDVVLRRFQETGTGDRETPQRWGEVRQWLMKDPEELRAWRQLGEVLTGLKDGSRVDPVSELAEFLGRDRFPLELKRVAVEVPDSLRVRPDGPLSLFHLSTTKKGPALVFEVVGDLQRDPQRRVTTYTFRPVAGSGTLTYQPGDDLWATLPLKDADNREWIFTWARSRSEVYQQERLHLPPRLHRRDQENTAGELATGVVLRATEGQGVPPVPDLMPVVISKR
jgi:hypothetical protein